MDIGREIAMNLSIIVLHHFGKLITLELLVLELGIAVHFMSLLISVIWFQVFTYNMGYIKWKQEKPDPDRWFPPWCIDAFPYITAASVVQIAVRAIVGTALVIGANRGESETDHAFQTLVSPAASHIHKIFIEPIPPVFRRLQQNVQSVANTTTLELEVSNQSGTLPMFCLGFDPAQSGVLDSSGPYGLPKFYREL